jgi:PBP1b-binding outer membrane lipoprotein LpoB
MTKKIISLTLLSAVFLTSCNQEKKTNDAEITHTESQMTDISYTVAKNYFVKNTVEELDNPKIETEEKFHEIFGMATTMGKDGMPTDIDFDHQYVIAVILPETDMQTDVFPLSLQKDENGEITLTYKTVIGEKQSYTTRPNFQIIVNKAENGVVKLKEEK